MKRPLNDLIRHMRFKVIGWPGSVKVPPRFICFVIMFLLYSPFVSAASFLFSTIACSSRLREDLVSQTAIAECARHLFLIKILRESEFNPACSIKRLQLLR